LAHGFTEFLRDERLRKQKTARNRRAMTAELAELIRQGNNQYHIDERLALLGMLASGSDFNEHEIAKKVSGQFGKSRSHGSPQEVKKRLVRFTSSSLRAFLQKYAMLDQNRISAHYGNYLTGDWLEEWVWELVGEALPHLREQIYLNLKLMASKTDLASPRGDFELDVAIYAGNQLHYIECKNKKTGADEALDRLHAAKRRFLGIYGKGWLFWARSMEPDSHMRAIAGSSGIGLFAGFREMEQAVAKLQKEFIPD
jgi:hypothetical protein